MNVAQAMTPALKKCVRECRPIRAEAQTASALASRIATSPPNNSSDKKMKVSETEMCALTLGIGMLRRGPIRIGARASNKKRILNLSRERGAHENSKAAAPAAVMVQR